MNAIETVYRGYKFRSRLEARYAYLFDELRFDWAYEPEGFHVEHGLYLPDFHIRDVSFWLEVKGTTPSPEEVTRATDLCATTHKTVWLVDGDLMHFADDETHLRHQCFLWMPADEDVLKSLRDDPAFQDDARVRRILLMGGEVSTLPNILPGHIAHLWQRGLLDVIHAADKMRSVRFEHGEEPSRTSWTR